MSVNLSTGEGIALIALIFNAAALVWGAAKISSSVENLVKLVDELKGLNKDVSEKVHTMIAKVAVINNRLKIDSFED